MNIREAIQRIAKDSFSSGLCRVASVVSVDGYTCVVKVLDTETEITDVRLQTEAANGVYLKPKVDSFVIIAPISDFEYVVVMYSAIDEIQFLDGSFGGLIKIADLVTKINSIENKVNSIINTFNSHTHAGVTTGGGTSGTTATPVSGTLPNTNRSEIENTKITHGDI